MPILRSIFSATLDTGHMKNKMSASKLLRNDLQLRRFLNEAHLLDPADDLDPVGKNRHKANDLRLQSLGAKESIFEQKKMPMSHRQGMTAKAVKKEEKRRREARENGIVLEKQARKAAPNKNKKRLRGVGGPSVGKFQGGMLKLSEKDISSMGSRKGGGVARRSRR